MTRHTTSPELSSVKALLAEEESFIRNGHFAGAGGGETMQRRTALIDRTLRDLVGIRASPPKPPTLIAIGGYGRGELNPHSDIDIMLLCRDQRQRERCSPLLYSFWDAGLDIGYSVRTLSECVELARSDARIRTSLLESRFIAGDHALYASYRKRMDADVFQRKIGPFIAEKIAERAAARRKFGGSLYLREPNIKESSGGMRDFHLARWIAMSRYRVNSFDELIAEGVITAGELAVFNRARNFLWRLRNELHYLSGRKNDQLTYDLQEAAARDFRYRDSRDLRAVERFMKAYFLHARTVQQFSRMIADRSLARPTRPWFGRPRPAGPFTLMGKVLLPTAGVSYHDRPEHLLEAFELSRSRHLQLSAGLVQLIKDHRFDDRTRRSPEAARAFLDMLDRPEGLAHTLTLMRDLKFLGRYVPEFRAIQGLARHDYYHLYTVDEHIMKAIGHLEDLWAGRATAFPTLPAAFRGLRKRWVLMLAVLLHDLGKAFRLDHELQGAELARAVLDRLGVAGEDRDRILFLVQQHLLMSVLSQRRELTDRSVIAEFCGKVGDRENLGLLYLLTYADMSAVGPATGTPWKFTLLQDLYLRALAHLDGQVVDERQRQAAASTRLREAAAGRFTEAETAAFLAAMPETYLLTTRTERMLEHLDWVRLLPREQVVIRHRDRPDRGCTELTICAYDAYGMFFRTAGTIASQGLNIVRAKIFTARNGVMIDTFEVTGADGEMVPHREVWESVKRELRTVLVEGKRPPEARISAYERMSTGRVAPSVSFDNESSPTLTIIDITARDRVGVLYRIAKTLYDLNLDIASAKIVTEGIRIMDSFYVSDLFRSKITDPDRLSRIRDALLLVLPQEEDRGPAGGS